MGRRGFTLLELILTVTVAGVLSLIAVTSYRAVASSTDRVSAQTSVRTVALIQQRLYSAEGMFADSSRLDEVEDSYTFVPAATSSQAYTEVSVDPTAVYDGLAAVSLAAMQDGECVVAVVVDPQLGDPATGSFTPASPSGCSATAALERIGTGEWRL